MCFFNGSSTGWTYDNNGNETAAIGASTRSAESWNSHDQLTSTTIGGTATAFTYSGTGQGTRLTAGSSSYRNSQTGVTRQASAGSTIDFFHDPQGTLVATRNAGVDSYYIFDGQGSVIALVNSSGTKINSYSYDPYGISRSKTEATVNPWQYTGGYLDSQTSLYKLGARYYDVVVGRFTSRDPSRAEANLFTYAGDSPVSRVDPTGELSLNPFTSILDGGDVGQLITDVYHRDISGVATDVIGIGLGYGLAGACGAGLAALGAETAGVSLLAEGACGVAGSAVTAAIIGNA